MNSKGLFSVGLVMCATLLVTLTGCVGYEEPYVFAAQDDYVYYPNYECYYSVSRHQYAYREGNTWVARPAPPGVTVNVLQASPSVKMDFHDPPVKHHAAVVKQYPKNWKPSGTKQGQNQKGDQREQHGENNGS